MTICTLENWDNSIISQNHSFELKAENSATCDDPQKVIDDLNSSVHKDLRLNKIRKISKRGKRIE
jgi:hypothetical protein